MKDASLVSTKSPTGAFWVRGRGAQLQLRLRNCNEHRRKECVKDAR